MRYIKCPIELKSIHPSEIVIFMAGGITGCPNWQSAIWQKLMPLPNSSRLDSIILVNPRRSDFDCSKSESSVEQIEWEFRHLNMSDYIYFWFPKEGACSITLFELGWALGAGKKVRVGVEPGYLRELDVREQLKMRAPWKTISTSLDDLYGNLVY